MILDNACVVFQRMKLLHIRFSIIIKLSRCKYIKILLGFLYNWAAGSHIYFVAETTVTDNCFTSNSRLKTTIFIFRSSNQNHPYGARAWTRKYIVFIRIRYNATRALGITICSNILVYVLSTKKLYTVELCEICNQARLRRCFGLLLHS